MGAIDRSEFALLFWEDLLGRLKSGLASTREAKHADLLTRVLVRLSIEGTFDTVEQFPLWDVRPVLEALYMEIETDELHREDVEPMATKFAGQLLPLFLGALRDAGAVAELESYASEVPDEASAGRAGGADDLGDGIDDDFVAAGLASSLRDDLEATIPETSDSLMDEFDSPAGAGAPMSAFEAMDSMDLPEPLPDLDALEEGGLESLLEGGLDMPDLLPPAEEPAAVAGAPDMPEMPSLDMPGLDADEPEEEEVPAGLESMDLSKMATMDQAEIDRLLATASGVGQSPSGELDILPDEGMSAEAIANLEQEITSAEAAAASVGAEDIDAMFLPREDEIDAVGAPTGGNGHKPAAAAAAATPATVPFEDQIRARMLLISESVEELAEGGTDKRVVDQLIEHFRAVSRPITRSGYRTFASLADVLVSTLEFLRTYPIKTPASLCNNLRELVLTLSEIVNGRWSKYKTFYWLINKLNATMRELEEEADQLEEQRFYGGFAEEEPEEEPVAERVAAMPSGEFQRAELTDLQEIFVQEANEHIDLLNRNLLLAEKNPTDQEIIYSLMRSAHSIKGSANISKYTHIGSLAHVMEDVMVAIRDNGLMMTPAIIDLLLASVDRLSAMLASVEYSKEFDEKSVEKLRGQLKSLGEELQTHPDRYKASAETIDAQLEQKIGLKTEKKVEDKKAEAGREANQVRVDIEDLNLLRNLAAELVINRTRLSGQLEVLRDLADGYTREKKLLSNVLLRLDRTIEEVSRELGDLFSSRQSLDMLVAAGRGNTAAVHHFSARVSQLEQSMRRLLRIRESGLLGEFSESEFDRFSELDIVWRDLRESVHRIDDLGDRFELVSNDLDQNISRISNIANDLHEQIMRVRMIPIGRIFNRFPRTVRDMARRLNKTIELVTVGEDTPLDKMIIEEIGDPLTHLVRNAIDHGIETREEREEFGKPENAKITLEARQEGNQVLIFVRDDGRGIDIEAVKLKAIERGLLTNEQAQRATDAELMNLIFMPGFSTAKETTDISGRGVGMDVVKTVITRLKGTVSLSSELGMGTQVTIRLPVTLAISQALLFRASGSRFAIPLLAVDETIMVREDSMMRTLGQEVVKLRAEILPVLRLSSILSLGAPEGEIDERPVIVVNTGDRRVGVIVDKLIGREEIVVKNLGRHLKSIRYVSGGTILGDGEVTLILDIFSIVDQARTIRTADYSSFTREDAPRATFDSSAYSEVLEEAREKVGGTKAGTATSGTQSEMMAFAAESRMPPPQTGGGTHILVVDDSISIRRFVGSILENAGYAVTLANDGVDALEKLRAGRFDLILTDLEMPRMHGYELIAEVKQNIAYKSIPIIILTGRAGEKHSRKGMELGAAAFLVKPFNEQELLGEINRNLNVTHS